MEDRATLLALSHEELVDRFSFMESQYENAMNGWRKSQELAEVWINKASELEKSVKTLEEEVTEYDRVLDTTLHRLYPNQPGGVE